MRRIWVIILLLRILYVTPDWLFVYIFDVPKISKMKTIFFHE